MFSVAVIEPGRVEIVEIPKPTPGAYDAVVKTEAAYVCNATDKEIIEGHFPGIEDYPLLLGHESVGIVESVGEKVSTFTPGDRVVGGLLLTPTDPKYVSGFGGFSEYILVRDHHAMVADGVADTEHGWDEVYKIQRIVPPEIPVEAAGLLCTWREVLGSFTDFRLQAGDDILVVGGGPVGLSFVAFARLCGMGYIGCVDSHPEKRRKAIELGADEVFERDDPRLPELLKTRGKPLDVVIDAVGREEIVNAALPLLRWEGSLCVYGVVGTHPICIDQLRGPKNVNIFLHQWPTRDTEAAAQETLCQWINEGKLDYREFISAEFPVAEVTKAIDMINARTAIKVVLRFSMAV